MTRPIVVQFASEIGVGTGVGGVAANLGREMRALGYEVEDVTLESLRLARPMRTLNRLSSELGHTYRVLAYGVVASTIAARRARRPDTVTISHNDSLMGDIYVNHGLLHPLMYRPDGGLRLRFLLRPLHLFLLGREWARYRVQTNHVVVNFSSAGEREHVDAVNLRDWSRVVIPNGVDLQRFAPDETRRTAARARLGLADKRVALMVVNEFVRKGVSIAAGAVHGCTTDDVRLVVIGGSEREIARFKRTLGPLAKVCVFAGRQSEDLPDYYRAADCYLLPSSQEAWPLVLLEAMASGLPCIATPVSSVPEIVEDGVTGLLAERSTPAFAAAIDELFADPEEMRTMGRRARTAALRYSWPVVARRYLDVVDRIAASKSALR